MSGEDNLKHYGVKGMRWGVRRNRNRPGGADGKDNSGQNGNKKPSRLKREIDSVKRERNLYRQVKKANNMSTKEIKALAKRAQLENDLKRLSTKRRVGSMKDRADYRRRGDMSDEELTRKVGRLKAKDHLNTQANNATKVQQEVGKALITVAAGMYIKDLMSKK